MKKLLFLATFSFLFVQLVQAVVLPHADYSLEVVSCEATASSQIQIVFGSVSNLSNLELLSSQQLEFKNVMGATELVDLTVESSLSIGATLDVVFSTTTSLNGLSTVSNQQLEFMHVTTGVTISVDFIVIDTIIH